MALKPRRVSVGTSPTQLNQAPRDRTAGTSLLIKAPTAGSIWVGGAAVTDDDGFELAAGDAPLAIGLDPDEDAYAVTDSGSKTVEILQQGA